MRIFLSLFFWLALAGPALAQTTGTLNGTVTTTDGQPVPFATVAVLNSTLGATADQGGTFSIANVPAGRQTVAVSSVGYAARTQTVTVAAGQAAALTFSLPASTAGLGEVVVVGPEGRNDPAANAPGRVGAGYQATARVPRLGFQGPFGPGSEPIRD